MGSRPTVALYGEDRGHVQVTEALLRRLIRDLGVAVALDTRNGRGGRGRALAELQAWQRALKTSRALGIPDLLVVVIDGNCNGPNATRREIEAQLDATVFPRVVIGVPDPHIERWFLADPEAFCALVGAAPPPDPGKCGRDVYKKLLRDTLDAAGTPIVTDVLELAPDLIPTMDLFRVAKAQPALGQLVQDLRRALRALVERGPAPGR